MSAFAFFDVFTRLGIVDHLTSIGVAVGIVNFPFMLWPVISTLEDQDPELTAAAATLPGAVTGPFLGAWLDVAKSRRRLLVLDRVMTGVALGALLLLVTYPIGSYR